jgi:cytochrome P450
MMVSEDHQDTLPENLPPGPRGARTLWLLARLLTNPLPRLAETVRTYGDVMQVELAGNALFVVNHPDHLRHILITHQDNYVRGKAIADLFPLLGEGLLTSDPALWKAQRRRMQPGYHRDHLATVQKIVQEETDTLCTRWDHAAASESPLAMQDEMKDLLLQILARTMFANSVRLDSRVVTDALNRFLTYASIKEHTFRLALWAIPQPFRPPMPHQRSMEEALQTLDAIVADIIGHCRADRADASPLMNALLDAEAAGAIPARLVRDEMMTLLLAGFDTVAQTLAWSLYLLANHPAKATRLHAEVDRVLGSKRPTLDDLAHLPYTGAVVQETLRLYPVVWAFYREASVADVIGGYTIPARSFIMLSPYLLHRHPDFWDAPEVFRPERFLGEEAVGARDLHYAPFGHGPHTCIGKKMALVECQLILARIAQRFHLRHATPPPKIKPGIIMQVDGPWQLTLARRG